MRKYNYVVLGSDGLYKYSYSDLFELNDVEYVPHFRTNINPIFRFLHRLHISKEINKRIKLPFKSIWNRFYYNFKFDNQNPICFLFFSKWPALNEEVGLTKYLRKKYPNCKTVWFLQDLYKNIKTIYNEQLDLNKARNEFDLIVSIDTDDCKNYGFDYHPLVFSSFHGVVKQMPQSDVYFLGKAKERLQDIIEVFKLLKSYNLKLDFHIVGVKEEQQVYADEIHYIDSMDYGENLQHVIHTKCLLEIMQKGQIGYTQRAVEAVCLGKKLLTNNPIIKDAPFYKQEFISQFEEYTDIDIAFVNNIPNSEFIDYQYKEKLSPIELLDFIDEKLR